MQIHGTAATPAPAPTSHANEGVAYARAGESIGDVAHRVGAPAQAVKDANPDLANPEHLLAGQRIKIPAHDDGQALSPAVAGVAGAAGREAVVQGQMHKAYQAGQAAPQEAFDGKVLRGIGTGIEHGTLDHAFGTRPGRYNSPSERMVYTSPDLASVRKEAAPYATKGQPLLAGSSVIELHYKATPDAQGRGGVADLAKGAQRAGLPVESLTFAKGPGRPNALHQLAGEHPYTLPQQASKGALDAGASGIKAPSAEAKVQINVMPANTQASQLKPTGLVRYDAHGQPGPRQPADHVKPLPANDKPVKIGLLDKTAGAQPPIGKQVAHGKTIQAYEQASTHNKPLSAGNQGIEQLVKGPRIEQARQAVTGASQGYPRAASTRYGAAGGAGATLVDAAISAARGKPVQAGQVAKDVVRNGAVGAASAKAFDVIAPRMGLIKAGGAVGGAIEASVSGYNNYQAYKAGQIKGSQAVANTVVDTGTAVAAGATGAAVGAAVGSVVPIAGTAVGAVAGFAAGVGVHYGIQALDSVTGATDKAKQTLASGIDSAGDAAGKAFHALTPW